MPQQVQRLRTVPLSAVLLAAGAAADRYDKARWHTCAGMISVTGCKFFNWNRACGGGGAIDLVIHLYGLDFKAALAWLSARFPNAQPTSWSPPVPSAKFSQPTACPDALPGVKQYLLNQRQLTPSVVDPLIRFGNLYADHHANAVFLLRDSHNAAVGAELRGTSPRSWRGMAPGSRKNLGYFSVRSTRIDAIVLCESAIDAISCLILQPHRCCISTAGARPNPAWMPDLLRCHLPILCGFDADPTGDDMAEAMIEHYPAITRLRPQRHDWNDLLCSLA